MLLQTARDEHVVGTCGGEMSHVPADLDGEVTADGAGGRVLGLGLAQHLAARGNGIASLPDLHGSVSGICV